LTLSTSKATLVSLGSAFLKLYEPQHFEVLALQSLILKRTAAAIGRPTADGGQLSRIGDFHP
jgi:hypothetical protein